MKTERIPHAWEIHLPFPEIFKEGRYYGYSIWEVGSDPSRDIPYIEQDAIYKTEESAKSEAYKRMLKSDRLVSCAKYMYGEYWAYKKRSGAKS